MNIFFKQLLLHQHKLSDLENQVFDYFLENQDELETFNLQELSDAMYISTATISRTCKKLGFSGFQEFQYSFKQVMHNPTENSAKYSGQNDYMKRVIEDIEKNKEAINREKIHEITKYLFESNFVEIFGVGRSYTVCREGASRLSFAGRLASARSDWDEQSIVCRYLTENDLAIFVSFSGETRQLINNIETLKKNKVPIIAIVGTKGSTLTKQADYHIVIEMEPNYLNTIDMSSQFLFSIFFDLLAVTYMEDKLHRELENNDSL